MYRESRIVKVLKNPEIVFKKAKRKLEHSIEDIDRTFSQQHIFSQVTNQKEIRIVGLMRTGNHAIIKWIQGQQTGKVWHLNNLQVNENPYRYKYEYLRDYYPQYQGAIERFQREARGDFTKKDCLLYSYEDYGLKQVLTQSFEKKHDLYLGKSAERYDLLVLRDPFNLLASRLKNNYTEVKARNKTVIDLWISYAKEYLGETHYLKHNKICVNYNRWTRDVTYRKQIAFQLKLDFSDAGINKVSGCGGGSSFEGRQFDGKASEMDVLNRWKHFAKDPSYRKLLNNQEMLEYTEKIFGHIPGTEYLFV